MDIKEMEQQLNNPELRSHPDEPDDENPIRAHAKINGWRFLRYERWTLFYAGRKNVWKGIKIFKFRFFWCS